MSFRTCTPLRRALASLPLLALLALLAPVASSHDWWLEPERTSAVRGESIAVAAKVGVAFAGERVARDPKRIRRFVALDAAGERPVAGAPGADPFGALELQRDGTTLLAYESEPARVYLRAPEFEAYLVEEGLEAIVAARAERGESSKMGLEQYVRCAKALLRTPDAPLEDRVAGLPFELVAAGDLAPLAAGGTLVVDVRFRGEPLAGVRVVALERDHRDAPVAARSDANGRVELPLPQGGFWLVKAVHMARLEGAVAAETRLDWQSWWASLTFEVPPVARAEGR